MSSLSYGVIALLAMVIVLMAVILGAGVVWIVIEFTHIRRRELERNQRAAARRRRFNRADLEPEYLCPMDMCEACNGWIYWDGSKWIHMRYGDEKRGHPPLPMYGTLSWVRTCLRWAVSREWA